MILHVVAGNDNGVVCHSSSNKAFNTIGVLSHRISTIDLMDAQLWFVVMLIERKALEKLSHERYVQRLHSTIATGRDIIQNGLWSDWPSLILLWTGHQYTDV